MASRRWGVSRRWRRFPFPSSWQRASWGRRSAWCFATARRRCCWCWRAACHSSSWSGSLGRPRRCRGFCGRRASCCRVSTRSTASSASTRWERASPRCGPTGCGSGRSRCCISLSPWRSRIFAAFGRRVMPMLSRRTLLLGTVPVLALAAVAVWYWSPSRAGNATPAVGMVRTTEIRIAPEISGRLARFLVEPGQSVQRGQPVAVLDNPELWAAVGEARAAVEKARADRDRVYAGVRFEQVQELEREIDKAQAVHARDVEELRRKSVLARDTFASQQELDIAKAAEARSAADILVAHARYAEAKRGPTDEERALADATVVTAQAARDVVEARAAKMLLRAPTSGVIGVRVAEPGEAVVPGEPVLTMVGNGVWFGFDLLEDALRRLAIGATVPVLLGSGKEVVARLVELRNWGEFATWRAARATGDHDLNTFFIRVDPAGPVADVAPGETVWLRPAAD